MWERFVAPTLQRDAANGDDIGTHQGGSRKGKHSVEGDGRADVYEGKGHGKQASKDDRVDWDVPRRVYLCKNSSAVYSGALSKG